MVNYGKKKGANEGKGRCKEISRCVTGKRRIK